MIKCPNCELQVSAAGTPGAEIVCEHCNERFRPGALEAAPALPESAMTVVQLVSVKTDETISLPAQTRMVVGREEVGREVLGRIGQVSRQHCLVEQTGGRVLVTDLGSTHGTFAGAQKTDCAKNKRTQVRDGDLLFLGREPFEVKLQVIESPSAQTENAVGISEESQCFDCHLCGWEANSAPPDGLCPKCLAVVARRSL